MFPYKDENPTILIPVVTLTLIVLNVACWIFVQGLGTEPALSQSVCQLGLIPAEFLGRAPAGTAVRISDSAALALPRPSVTVADGLSKPYFLRSAGLALSETIDFICADDTRPSRPSTAELSDAA